MPPTPEGSKFQHEIEFNFFVEELKFILKSGLKPNECPEYYFLFSNPMINKNTTDPTTAAAIS